MNNAVNYQNEMLSQHLLADIISKEEIDRVFGGTASAEIGPEFLGFLVPYKMLSEIIDEEYIVIDIGCGYNPQSYFFDRHKQYIAISPKFDPAPEIAHWKPELFSGPDNCTIVETDARGFIEDHLPDILPDGYTLNDCFTICNYVPLSDEDSELVRKTFKNIYNFYPTSNKYKWMQKMLS